MTDTQTSGVFPSGVLGLLRKQPQTLHFLRAPTTASRVTNTAAQGSPLGTHTYGPTVTMLNLFVP